MTAARSQAAVETTATMTLIFITDYPFLNRDRDRHGFAVLERRGLDVQVWDLSRLLRPEFGRALDTRELATDIRRRSFEDRTSVVDAVGGLPSSARVICLVSYELKSLWLYRALSSRRVPYGFVWSNPLPAATGRIDRRWVSRTRTITLAKVARRLVSSIPFRWLGVRPASFAVAAGTRSVPSRSPARPFDETTTLIWAHAFDYDAYLTERRAPARPASIAVFLDEYLPFHPDFVFAGRRAPEAPGDYFEKLRGFFSELEAQLQLSVVVAAHPRADYDRQAAWFGDRLVVKGQTPSLVRTANVVIAHASTAINLAVLFEKPVIFVTTDKIAADALVGPNIDAFSGALRKLPINLDRREPVRWSEELSVNREAYDDYRDQYIKADPSPDAPCWEIVADALTGAVGTAPTVVRV